MERERRRRSRVGFRAVVVAILFATGAWGCALIAGVDFDAVHIDPLLLFEGGPRPEGDGAVTPEAGCAKTCAGACVSLADPEYGCAAPDCAPCSLATTTGSTCAANGACAPKTCSAGFDDCDHDPTNGCEADLTRPETCGSCGKQCGAGKLCSPTGCVDRCTPPLVPCNGACVDTTSSVAHCGGCNQACDGGANADPKCTGSACVLDCRAGFADCTNNPAKKCTALPKWFVDGDGDNFGGTAFVSACAQPAGHVATGGDCLDTNASVHPGAAASDVPFAGPNGPSFDYDCNGTEVEVPPSHHYGGTCGVACDDGGALPLPARAGAGVDDFCGSSGFHICFVYMSCISSDYDSGTKIKCN